MITTYFIKPALSDQAGQCRIYRKHFGERDGAPSSVTRDYDADPGGWREVGLMNSRGRLVCLDAEPHIIEDIKTCEPLMAGLHFTYGDPL